MQDYDWKKDLDEGIWPQPWPDRGSRSRKMKAVFEDNETSKKQLEYMHIYLYHKGCSAIPKQYPQKTTLNTGTNILGINQTLQTALFFSGIFRKQKNGVFSKKVVKHFWNRS